LGWGRRFESLIVLLLWAALACGPAKALPLSKDHGMARGRRDAWGRVVRPSIGMQQMFWVRVPNDTFGLIYQYAQRSATLRRTGKHCYLFVGDNLSLPDSLLDDLQATYDSIVYPTCRKYFGHEWSPGIDNDSLVTVLFEPQMAVGFYFSTFDEMADSLAQTYGHRSNEREMFYIGLDSPPDSASILRIKALMAHGQEHLICWYQNPPCEIWLNEACAMYAMDLCGFGSSISELNFFQKNTSLDIPQWPSGLIDFPANSSDSIPGRRGMGYALLAYLMEKYPGKDPQDPLIYHLVARRDLGRSFLSSGIGAIEWTLREVGYWPPIYFRDILPFWAIANFLNDTTLGGPSKPYGYRKPLGGQTRFVADPTFGPPQLFKTLPDSLIFSLLYYYGQACVYIPSGKTDRRIEFVQDTFHYEIEGVPYTGFVYNVNLVASTSEDFTPGTNTLTPLPPETTIPLPSNSTIKGVKIILSLPYLYGGGGGIPATHFFVYAPLSPAETSGVNKTVYVFPNPFNPDREKVHFRYVVTAPSKVDIRVYDAGGNQVAIVAEEQWQTTPAIYNSQTWDGRNYRGVPVANGVYFGRVKVGDKTTGVKIAVMR